MLFLVVGASGSGKTTLIKHLGSAADVDLVVHDFDEIGVPERATPSWRQHANEEWLQRILREYADQDVLLAGNTPLGELLATPSATSLDCLACCLLDCSPSVRRRRVADRERFSPYWMSWQLSWAAWLRRHAHDPQWEQGVIRHQYAPAEMRWERWVHWSKEDPRWQCEIIDTSNATVLESVGALIDWVRVEQRLRARNRLARNRRWWDGGLDPCDVVGSACLHTATA